MATPRGRSGSVRRSTIARWAFGFSLALYSAAVFTVQHRHLTATALGASSSRLEDAKEAFLGGRPSTAFDSGGGGIGDGGDVAGRTVLSHRPAHLILQNPKLPDWVKRYAAWHRVQRRRYLDAKRGNSSDAANDVRFLVSRCLLPDKCGGASDRLQDMPYNLILANRTSRVLLVRWEKPAPLEHYLVPPPVHGIDWTIDDELDGYLRAEGDWHLRGKEADAELRIVSSVRRDSAAPIFRKYENEEVGHKIYHEIFRLLFAPSKVLAERVEATMNELGLVPHHYSSVHLRVKYPVRGVNERDFTFRKHKHQIVKWATNAVNCAAELHPNSTIYVSSDNNDTVGYLLEESHFAKHYADAAKHNKHPAVRLVARDYSEEVKHVAFSGHPEADGFLNVFEDLTIMGMGRCVAHGVGGYGRLGAALSGGECVAAHRDLRGRMRECSDALARTQARIDP